MGNVTDNSSLDDDFHLHTVTDIDPKDLMEVLSKMKSGIVVYSGFTGSGKSYSQMQFLNHLNETQALRIFTIEDPIEHVYTNKNSNFYQYEVYRDIADFPKGSCLLANGHPDVLQIAEMRDSETTAVAIEAALEMLIVTSHHMDSVEGAYKRIIDNLPQDEIETLSEDLAALPMVIVQLKSREITRIVKLDPRA